MPFRRTSCAPWHSSRSRRSGTRPCRPRHTAPRSVTPATNLGDQVVQVSWEGFRPTQRQRDLRRHDHAVHRGSELGAPRLQHAGDVSVLADRQPADGVTHTDGTGSTFIDIMTTGAPAVARLQRDAPVLAAAVRRRRSTASTRGRSPKNRVIVPLSFEKSFGDCPPVQQLRRPDRDREPRPRPRSTSGRRTSAPASTPSPSTSRTRRRTRRARTSSTTKSTSVSRRCRRRPAR